MVAGVWEVGEIVQWDKKHQERSHDQLFPDYTNAVEPHLTATSLVGPSH